MSKWPLILILIGSLMSLVGTLYGVHKDIVDEAKIEAIKEYSLNFEDQCK